MAPWAIGMNAKEYRAALGRKPVVGLFSVGVEEAYRWKDSVQSGDEIRLWAADLLANGMRPWYSKFAGALHDRRWLAPVEQIYGFCHANEKYLRNERPLARVGLVYSQQTAWNTAPETLKDAGGGPGARHPTRRSSRRASPSRWSTTSACPRATSLPSGP
jgi:hypothetical protein